MNPLSFVLLLLYKPLVLCLDAIEAHVLDHLFELLITEYPLHVYVLCLLTNSVFYLVNLPFVSLNRVPSH